MQNNISALDFLPGAGDADALYGVFRFTQAGGVHNMQWHAIYMDFLHHFVARGARNRGDDSDVVARQGVQQTGFTHVGLASQNHVQTLAQDDPLACLRDQPRQVSGKCIKRGPGLILFQKIDLFFGEIQRCLDQHAQVDDAVGQVVHARRELARQRSHGAARGGDR
ncbi:hypothetical protein D3C73_779780 [compost metagenome]